MWRSVTQWSSTKEHKCLWSGRGSCWPPWAGWPPRLHTPWGGLRVACGMNMATQLSAVTRGHPPVWRIPPLTVRGFQTSNIRSLDRGIYLLCPCCFYGMQICGCVFKKHSIIIPNTYFHFHESSVLPSAHELETCIPILSLRNRFTEVEDLPKVTQTLNDRAGHQILSLGQCVSTGGNCALQGTYGSV